MNKSTQIIGIILIVILVAGGVFFWSINKYTAATSSKSSSVVQTSTAPMPSSEQLNKISDTPSQNATVTLTTSPSSTLYTTEFRAKARSTFIANCITKFGQQYSSSCSCGAEYLAAHYTDAELTRIYLEYHSSSKVPDEIQAAYNACK